MTKPDQTKLIALVGPTGVGKTAAALRVAEQLNLELVSADSRQLYQGMDIGTGKEVGQGQWQDVAGRQTLIINNTPIHGLNLTTPDQPFSITQWHQQISSILADIRTRNKQPLIVGGTGFYLQALTGQISTMSIPPNPQLRQQLSQLTAAQLLVKLQQLDQAKAQALNYSDQHNPTRLTRLIELASGNHLPPPTSKLPKTDLQLIGLTMPRADLYPKVDSRIDHMIQHGLVAEVQNLLKHYHPTLQAFKTIGYQEIIAHLQGHTSLDQATQLIKNHTHHYIRRQQTWFNKQSVRWLNVIEPDIENRISEIITQKP